MVMALQRSEVIDKNPSESGSQIPKTRDATKKEAEANSYIYTHLELNPILPLNISTIYGCNSSTVAWLSILTDCCLPLSPSAPF